MTWTCSPIGSGEGSSAMTGPPTYETFLATIERRLTAQGPIECGTIATQCGTIATQCGASFAPISARLTDSRRIGPSRD
jgi:hypothetical protein